MPRWLCAGPWGLGHWLSLSTPRLGITPLPSHPASWFQISEDLSSKGVRKNLFSQRLGGFGTLNKGRGPATTFYHTYILVNTEL